MKPSRALYELLAHGINKHIGCVVGMLVLSVGACGLSALFAGPTWGAGGDILWQEEFDRKNFYNVNGMAAEGKRLYVAVAGEAYLVRAYDGRTGTLLWQDDPFVGVPNYTSSAGTIAADDGQVYVAGRLGGDLLVRAYHGKTGTLLWQDVFDLAGKDDFAQKITVEGRHVYVGGVGTIRTASPGDAGNTMIVVRAYDAQTGKIFWQNLSDVTAETQRSNVTSIAAKKGRVYVAGNRDNGALVRAYDGNTGMLLWQNQEQIAGFTAIGAGHGRVYASGYRRNGFVGLFFVRTYDGDTGTVLWQDLYTLSGVEDSASAAISISGGRVYAVGYGTSGVIPGAGVMNDFLVRAYDGNSGIVLWQDNFHGAGYRTNVAMAVDSGVPAASPDGTVSGRGVYVAGFTTSAAHDTAFVVRAYEGNSGVLLWKDDLIRPGLDAAFEIAVENGRAYAAGYVNADTAGHLLIRAYDTK
jgi:putative pyrroloquinoline-quinone binding quinoprotein